MLHALMLGCVAPLALSLHPQGDVAEASRVVRGLAEDVLATARLPSLSVAIALDGKLVFAEAFGLADLEKKTPASPATRYRTASVCKLVTVTALAKLVEQGKVDLDGSIHEHVTYDPPNGADITFRQLAGHLGGVEHYSRADRADAMAQHHDTATSGLAVFAHKALLSEPGTAYRYSTHGYTLLGAALEGASGKDFLALIASEVFTPLRMSGSGPDLRREAQKDAAVLYDLGDAGPVVVAAPEDPSYKWPAGGLLSTPTDVVRLGRAYLDGFVPAALAKEWWTPQKLADGSVLDLGIGWRLSSDRDGRRVVEHAGSMEGARSVLCVYPDHGLVIALMTNASWSGRVEQTARLFALPFLVPAGDEVPAGGELAVTGKDPEGALEGSAKLAEGRGELVLASGKTLRIRHLRGDDYALIGPNGALWLELATVAKGWEGRAYGMESGTAAVRPAQSPVAVLELLSETPPR